MKSSKFPPGWDEARVERVLNHYEQQTDAEALAEDEERFEAGHTVMEVPAELVLTIRQLIAKQKAV